MTTTQESVKAKFENATPSEIATEIARVDATMKTMEDKRKALVGLLVEGGHAGERIPTISGEMAVELSSGIENRLDLAKLIQVIGQDAVDSLMDIKRDSVKLSINDTKGYIPQGADVYTMVKATVKARVIKG